jgi:hypothetical protein
VQVLQNIKHAEDGYDAVVGAHVPVPVSFSRPDWKGVFERLHREHPGARIGVFVCGPAPACAVMKGYCRMFSAHPRRQKGAAAEAPGTTFVYHRERF